MAASLSAKQFNEYASHEAFLFCIHTSTHRTLPCRLCRFSGFGARFDRKGGVHWYGVLEQMGIINLIKRTTTTK